MRALSNRSTICAQVGIETKIRSADRVAQKAINLLAQASTRCLMGWPAFQPKATSWNMIQTGCLRNCSQRQKLRFIAFQPNACGTYCTRILLGTGQALSADPRIRSERIPKWSGNRCTVTPLS